MRNIDFAPFARSAIGFEHLFDRLNDRSYDYGEGYPPYNIVRKDDDRFQITLALAGFSPDDITITSKESQLTITGERPTTEQGEYVYQGISGREFERRFSLADYVEVENASFEHGLLKIDLVRQVPDRMKPKRIPIGNQAKLAGTGKAA